MGDRLQRILAKQQEHERRMRERDMVKAAFEAPPKEVVNRIQQVEPDKPGTEAPKPADKLDEVVGQSRWKKSEYGWSQLDDSRGSASHLRGTSRESNAYIAPITYTFLPTKDYEMLDIHGALNRPDDFAVACNVLEVLVRQYYASTLLSTQNKMYTDVRKANALLSSPAHQTRPNYRSALFLFRTCIKVLYETVQSVQATKSDQDSAAPVWPCANCSYLGNKAESTHCVMCAAPKPEEELKTAEVTATDVIQSVSNEKSPVGGTLARLQRERQELEQRTITQQTETETPNQEEPSTASNLRNANEQPAQEDSARQAKIREEEEKARERERKGSNLGGRHENRIREVVQMYITQSEAMSKILPPGDGVNHFQNLPEEVIAYIFTFVLDDLDDINSINCVCRQWHDIVGDDHLSKELTRLRFPQVYTSVLRNSTTEEGGWKNLYLRLLYEEIKNTGRGLAWCAACGDIWWRYQGQCSTCRAALPRYLPPHNVPKALVTRNRPTPRGEFTYTFY